MTEKWHHAGRSEETIDLKRSEPDRTSVIFCLDLKEVSPLWPCLSLATVTEPRGAISCLVRQLLIAGPALEWQRTSWITHAILLDQADIATHLQRQPP